MSVKSTGNGNPSPDPKSSPPTLTPTRTAPSTRTPPSVRLCVYVYVAVNLTCDADALKVLDDAPVDPRSFWGRSLALSAVLERKIGIEARGIDPARARDRAQDRPSGNLFTCV
jgi:hypothetical protein